jgi:hypothetical protein
MKSNAKSCITLPPKDLREVTDRDALRAAYRQASRATRASLSQEIEEVDHLASEGLSEE